MEEPFTTDGTIGVEEEFYAVDATSLEPGNASDDLLQQPPQELAGKLDVELFKSIIEMRTTVCDSIDELDDEIRTKRQYLKEYAATRGYSIVAAGIHPMARWRELEHVQKPRYKQQMERIRYPQLRNLTAGLHVHVGVRGAEKAMYIVNEIRRFLPLLLGISANSPFWNAQTTGLQSSRAIVFENLPTTGIPTRFDSFHAFKQFEETMLETGSIDDRGEIWWDVRPHTEYGTVEVRIMDTQVSRERTVAFAKLVKALVDLLGDRYDERGGTTSTAYHLIEENKWRAARYGSDALFIRDGDEHSIETELERLQQMLDIDNSTVKTLQGENGADQQLNAFEGDNHHHVCEEILI